jgi:hypothetical protein
MAVVADIEALIATARRELGTTESPPFSNRQKYGLWYGMNGVAWCAMYVSWVFWHSGNPLPKITTAKGFAYCPELERYGRETGTYHAGTAGIKRGDILLFSFGKVRSDHVAIVQGVLPDGRIHTIEGNTNAGGSRTGGGVYELYRRSGIKGYVRVTPKPKAATAVDWVALRKWLAADLYNRVTGLPTMWLYNAPHPLYVVTLQEALNLVRNEKLKVDGIYGPEVDWSIQRFQRDVNKLRPGTITENAGTFGPQTKWMLATALDNIAHGR